MKLVTDRFSLNASMPKKPLDRSPRQCIAPELVKPRSVCVVIGPFIGGKSSALPLPLSGVLPPDSVSPTARMRGLLSLMGMGFLVTVASGFPRSHERSSLSPNIWQLEQDASPLPEKRVAS